MPGKYILAWFILFLVAILNGTLRETVYGNYMSELAAHQVSTVTGILLLGLVIRAWSRRWPLPSARAAWTVGMLWVFLTMAFEFLFGHFVAGRAWCELWQDYDLLSGRIWLLVLLWVALAPYIFFKLASIQPRK